MYINPVGAHLTRITDATSLGNGARVQLNVGALSSRPADSLGQSTRVALKYRSDDTFPDIGPALGTVLPPPEFEAGSGSTRSSAGEI